MATFDAYAEDAGLAPKTRSAWRSKIRDLIAFVGHDDLARLTRKEVLAWKEKLQTEILPARKAKRKNVKLAACVDAKPAEPRTRDRKTIRNVYLAALRATLTFAVNREDLTENVAKGIVVKVKKKKKQREKGFTADEARRILAASLEPPPKGLSAEMAAARRWVPWICAYTGARVNEITQLTPADFEIEEGFHYIRLDATATKTRDYRRVPLHEHLLEEGLLNYVRFRGKRPLFYDPKRSRGGDGLHFRKVGERLAEWVRNTVGVVDKEVQPNHGWRHRFSSLARAVDMHVDVQNIIQGHVGERTASDYGDAWVSTAHREISKLPRYIVR